MKKLFLAFAMLATACCYAQTSHTGITKTKDGADQPWVQLWKGGPKWAMYNVGSSIADYADVHVSEARKQEKYSTKNVGGHYTWGGATDCGYSDAASNLSLLKGENDTATQLWGNSWRMPTKAELYALYDRCSWEWMDGIKKQYVERCSLPGYKITGRGEYSNDSIFLPASGWCLTGKMYDLGVCGYLWSSECDNTIHSFSDFIHFGNATMELNSDEYNRYAFSVRAVAVER